MPEGFIHKNTQSIFEIVYAGIPGFCLQAIAFNATFYRDGLVISNNKFGKRCFFGDNWPNRAHQSAPTQHPVSILF